MDNHPRFGAPYWIRGRSERPNDGVYFELKFLIMGRKWEKIDPWFYEFLESLYTEDHVEHTRHLVKLDDT